jgi:quercetin dioxygenase-like cupin family protein
MSFQFYVQRAAEGNPLHIPEMGLELRVTLPSSASGEALTILETVNAPAFGPPLHRHRETEVFRVLEGRYLYEVDGRRFEAGEGDTVSVPGGAAHAFVNISSAPGRQLVMMIPGMDAYGFFAGLGHVFAQGRPTREALNAYGAAWHMEFLGTPIKAN